MKRTGQKHRLDQLLHRRYPELSRSRVQSEIMAGNVLVDGSSCDKPGTLVSENAAVQLLEPDNPYVSRGGLKLEGALFDLSIAVKDLVVLDVGASTGGFTDCLLKKGAGLVYALDVGYGQLDFSLRNNPRVVLMERFNVRRLKTHDIPTVPDLAVVDVSFISLAKVLPVLGQLKVTSVLALVKPQFEAGRREAGKGKGVIRDPDLHRRVLTENVAAALEIGYYCRGMTFSKYPGPKGNLEFFIYYADQKKEPGFCQHDYTAEAARVVEQAHSLLLKEKK